MKTPRRNYIVLLLLSLLFAAPGLSAYIFYMHPSWLGEATTNKGAFLNPPVLQKLAGSSTAHPKWQLLLWTPKACKTSCISQLDKLARIRLALGRRLYDVDARLLISADAPPLSDDQLSTLHEQDIYVEKLSAAEYERLFVLKKSMSIFIANPNNYLVLAYSPLVKPDDIYRDIKQLLTK